MATRVHGRYCRIMSDSNEYNDRGAWFQHCLEVGKAIADFTKPVEMYPGCDSTYRMRGEAYFDIGEYDKAIVAYTKEIELCHQAPIAFYERGRTYKALGKKLEAIADFEEYIKLSKEPELVKEAKQEVERLRS